MPNLIGREQIEMQAYILYIRDSIKKASINDDVKATITKLNPAFDKIEFDCWNDGKNKPEKRLQSIIDAAHRIKFNFINDRLNSSKQDQSKSIYKHFRNYISIHNVEVFEDLGCLFECKTFGQFLKMGTSATKIEQNFFEDYLHKAEKFVHPKLIEFDNIKGFYYIFACSSFRRGIVSYPLFIYENGDIEISPSNSINVSGKASFYENKRVLNLDFFAAYKGNDPFLGAWLFNINYLQLGFSSGVSMRCNTSFHIQSKREFLLSSNLVDNQDLSYEKMKEEFDKTKFSVIYPGEKLYQKLEAISPQIQISSMLGQERNLIITIVSDKLKDLFNREAFDKIYFHQAILEYLKDKNIDAQKVDDYFALSMEHGLFLENRFDQYFTEFTKSVNLGSDEKTIKENFLKKYQSRIKNIKER